jgi:hypothetical protein
MRTRKRTGAPRRFALSETLSSFRAQSVFEPEPLETNDRLGIVRHALLDVDTGVVRQTAAWRSSSPPERPEPAASTTRGTAAATVAAAIRTSGSLRIGCLLGDFPLPSVMGARNRALTAR